MKIIISPYSNKLSNGNRNAKNYPHWRPLVQMLTKAGHELTQVGIKGEEVLMPFCHLGCKMEILYALLRSNDTFISVDNFFHHFAHYYKKRGIVLFSKSDPKIFGYEENINLQRDNKYLRPHMPDQFDTWLGVKYQEEAFVKPERVLYVVNMIRSNILTNNS